MSKYEIQSACCGLTIEECDTLEEAKAVVEDYIKEDLEVDEELIEGGYDIVHDDEVVTRARSNRFDKKKIEWY